MMHTSYHKPELEFFDASTIEERQVEGYPDGIYERTLSKDEASGDCTRLLYFKPGVVTTEVLAHDCWEEVYIVQGGLVDLTRNETYLAGYYACRPPGMKHGPYAAPDGCIAFEVRYHR